jgi:hypothetical protein
MNLVHGMTMMHMQASAEDYLPASAPPASAAAPSGAWSWRDVLWRGAAIGVATAWLYALLFIVYRGLRYAADLLAAPPDEARLATLAAGEISLVIAALVLAALAAIPAAVLGGITALLTVGLAAALNLRPNARQRMRLALIICLTLILLMHLLLIGLGLLSLGSLFAPTYLLWLGIPSLFYLAAGALSGWRLDQEMV